MNQKPKKIYFITAALVFFCSILIFFYIGVHNFEYIQKTFLNDAPDFSQFSRNTPFENFLFILFNNSTKALLVIALGILFGIFPLYFMYANGQIIGVVAAMVYLKTDFGVVLAGLLPHGITESFAIILSAGYGIWLGINFFRLLFLKEQNVFRRSLGFALIHYFKVILPLLIISALIEAYITPAVIHLFGG